MKKMKLKLDYVTARKNKSGKLRYYFRKSGFPFSRLPDDFKSPEFMEAYKDLTEKIIIDHKNYLGTFAWACDQYQKSTNFLNQAQSTQIAHTLIMRSMQDELIDPDYKQTFGDTRLTSFTRKHIEVLRDRKRDVPNAANKRLKVLNGIFKHALRNDYIATPPNIGIEKFAINSNGHKTATDKQIEQYMAYHPKGPATLAMRLLQATGARVSDLRILGLPNLTGTIISFKTVKTNMLVEIDIGEALANELRATNRFVFLHSYNNQPFKSDKSTSAAVSKWFKQAGVEGITAHSVRKWLATRMANQGVDEFGLMAFFGWRDSKEAKPYTQTYNRRNAAQKAVDKIANM